MILCDLDIYSQFQILYLKSLNGYKIYCTSVFKCLYMDEYKNHYVMKCYRFHPAIFRVNGNTHLNEYFCVSGILRYSIAVFSDDKPNSGSQYLVP